MTKLCEELFWVSPWGPHRSCGNRAKVERHGKHYCGVHDPVAKAKRRAKRGPTAFEREVAFHRKTAARLAAAEKLAEAVREIDESTEDCGYVDVEPMRRIRAALAEYEEAARG